MLPQEISHNPCTKRCQTRRERLARASKLTVSHSRANIQLSMGLKVSYAPPILCAKICSFTVSSFLHLLVQLTHASWQPDWKRAAKFSSITESQAIAWVGAYVELTLSQHKLKATSVSQKASADMIKHSGSKYPQVE